jgi:orotate phosphoribosyltransferase
MSVGHKKSEVIDFLVSSGALKFGDFTLKSGRKAPYFINTGCFDDGAKISRLGEFYADTLLSLNLSSFDSVFGPAYKGIPLSVAAASAYSTKTGMPCGFTFNRKEAKTRGEGGWLVGKPLLQGNKVVIVEDVVTAGTTLQEVVPMLRETLDVEVVGVIILVDRMEKGSRSCSAVQEAEQDLGIKVHPIVTITEIIEYLSSPNSSGLQLDPELLNRIQEYRKNFGA